MLVDFNDLDSDLIAVIRTAERFAERMNVVPVFDPSKAEDFIEARRRHTPDAQVYLAAAGDNQLAR